MNEDQEKQKVREVIHTWLRATAEGDLEWVLSLMAEDVVFLLPGQPPMIGRAAFAAAAQAQSGQEPPQFEGTSEIQEIRVCGDWAYMWTRLTVVVTPPGGAQPITRAGHTLSIL